LETQSDLLRTVERLQKDMFWMKCTATVLFICLAGIFITTWFRHPKTLDANEFLVTDRTGNVVARLGQLSFGATCLTLTANQQVSVADLCVQNDEGASLDLHNLKSESRATLTPGFKMYEPMGHVRAGLAISENGHPISGISHAANTPD
jgi:hypothetical protein